MKSISRFALLFTSILYAPACGKDNPVEELEGVYVPLFTNFWPIEKGLAGDAILLNAVVSSIDSSRGTGLLTGSLLDNSNSYDMKGSFRNLNVDLRCLSNAEAGHDNGPLQGQQYKGRYDTIANPFRIRMVNIKNTSDSLVIRLG